MKDKYLAYDAINGEYEHFSDIEDARKWITDVIYNSSEGYHPDLKECKIYKIEEVVEYDVIDKKSDYKYENEEDIPEDDLGSEAWPYSNDFIEIWKHKFTAI